MQACGIQGVRRHIHARNQEAANERRKQQFAQAFARAEESPLRD